jgi:glycosyltransferase involved in cell wall biosynthesis
MDAAAVAAHLSACDLLLQPYIDGISTRRSSAMAGLALGVPIATSAGEASEPIWAESGAVALAATPSMANLIATVELLLADAAELAELRARGRSLYQNRFDLRFTIEALRASPA